MSVPFQRVVVEDLLSARSGELRRETRCLLAPELPVVFAPHFVSPAVAVGDGETHPVLSKHPLEPGAIRRAGVGQRREHLVTEHLLEAARRERLAAQFPFRLGLGRFRQHAQTFVTHQLVVDLTQPVLPGGIPLQGLPGEVVVIDNEDVRVSMAPGGVSMDDDKIVGTVHPPDEPNSDIPHPVEVCLARDVELVGMKREHVGIDLVRTSVCLGESLGSRDELLGRRAAVSHRQGERSRPGLTVSE